MPIPVTFSAAFFFQYTQFFYFLQFLLCSLSAPKRHRNGYTYRRDRIHGCQMLRSPRFLLPSSLFPLALCSVNAAFFFYKSFNYTTKNGSGGTSSSRPLLRVRPRKENKRLASPLCRRWGKRVPTQRNFGFFAD